MVDLTDAELDIKGEDDGDFTLLQRCKLEQLRAELLETLATEEVVH